MKGEAVFIIGRVLENMCFELLQTINKKLSKDKKMKIVRDTSFDTKINLLNKKGVINPSQYSKLLSVKWDRNDFGHNNAQVKEIEKNADVSIRNGISLIFIIENKLDSSRKGSN